MQDSDSDTAMNDLTGIGRMLEAALPHALRFDLFDGAGEPLWSSGDIADRTVSGALLALPEDAFAGGQASRTGRRLRLHDGRTLHVFPVGEDTGDGLLTCLMPDPPGDGGAADTVARIMRPAADLVDVFRRSQREGEHGQQAANSARTELELLYDLDEQLDQAPHGQARLARLVGGCARHLGIGYSVLILPSKRVRISATHPSWKKADRRALDTAIVKRFLPSLSRRTTPSILDVSQVPPGVEGLEGGYQVLLCPLREGAHRVAGVLALVGRVDGRPLDDAARRFAALIARKAERVIEGNYDPLTGLVNRTGFEAHLREAYDELHSDDDGHMLVLFDVDKLQLVNDNFGHRAGDDYIRRFAAELQEALPECGVATRLSGDNFAVLLHRQSVDEAMEFAEDVRRRAQKLVYLRGDKALKTTVSAGIAAYRRDSGGVSGALVAPKVACTAAKEHGGDRVEVYDKDDHSIIRRAADIQLVGRLHNALDNDDFELVAQPIARLAGDAAYRHHEVLVRMFDDEGRHVLPDGFLSAAERYQLMPKLDRWIVDRALTQIAAGRALVESRQHRFGINLSGQSLGDDAFLDFVFERVRESGLPPGCLCFEITETAAVANMERARAFMASMRRLGCHFSLDDFGSGLSSFAYLKNFPVDSVKIDGSFVRDVTENRISEAMIAAITQVARVMGLETIAEFVTSDAICRRVRELGVDYAQGYFVGEPVALADVLTEEAGTHARTATAS